MKTEHNHIIQIADWSKHQNAIQAVRRQVFILEQQVPEQLEWDGLDHDCLHFIAITNHQQIIGTARLYQQSHIGRMAILKPYRGLGIGSALLTFVLQHCQQEGYPHLHLNAQLYVCDFYQKLGFVAQGAVFKDAGIDHREMTLDMSASRL